ncbi:glycosyltransferase family 87 protein [Croceibacterium aestuarii]|uniref:glycosyltransferase family 87 protein n=1 Tax=Croceibacterium aestuarii TaxID=3064139 RepID=UPI00272EC9CA|nr:glycosyltransferase family 87 protein [Croceibacterium sp. D39]
MGGNAFDLLRDADWLNGQRVRVYAAMIGLVSLALLGVSWWQAQGGEGSDFLAFWGAGKAVLAGQPSAAYDLHWQEQVQTSTGSAGWFAFVNPPPFLFLVWPFALLRYPLAWIAWVALTYAVWARVSASAFPRLWLLALVFPGALIAAGHAQNGFVTGALLVGGVALLDRRPVLAGMLFGALVIKPHLALLVPFWLAAGGRWRAFVAAGASAIGLLLAAWATLGSATMLAYTESWAASAAIMRTADADFLLRMATAYSQVRLLAGGSAALVVAGALAAATIALVALSWRRMGPDGMASGAFMLAATAVASPYLFNYDLPFLVLPLFWLVCQGLRDGFRPWEKLLLVALWFAPYATRAAALPLGLNLMPLAALLLAWLVWTRGNTPAPTLARGEPAGAGPVLRRDGSSGSRRPKMSSYTFRSSRPDSWIQPRPHQDASLRLMKYGRIQPMEEPGFLARLLGRC